MNDNINLRNVTATVGYIKQMHTDLGFTNKRKKIQFHIP